MIFPLPIHPIGGCIAVVSKGMISFKPYLRMPVNENKEYWTAHRLSFSLNVYPIDVRPPNQKEGFVLHSCHNKWCVNPDHLSIGTCRQNSLEAHAQMPDWRIKQSNKIKGVKHTPEHNARIAAAGLGRKHTAETKAKMSESAKRAKRELRCAR